MENRAIWEGRVAEWKASGLTSEKYSEGKSFTAGGLRHWAYRLGMVNRRKPKAATIRLARVVREATPEATERKAAAEVVFGGKAPAEALVVECGAVRVAVRPGFDQGTLAAVLDVLAARGGRP